MPCVIRKASLATICKQNLCSYYTCRLFFLAMQITAVSLDPNYNNITY